MTRRKLSSPLATHVVAKPNDQSAHLPFCAEWWSSTCMDRTVASYACPSEAQRPGPCNPSIFHAAEQPIVLNLESTLFYLLPLPLFKTVLVRHQAAAQRRSAFWKKLGRC